MSSKDKVYLPFGVITIIGVGRISYGGVKVRWVEMCLALQKAGFESAVVQDITYRHPEPKVKGLVVKARW